jgi:hypothetical protein
VLLPFFNWPTGFFGTLLALQLCGNVTLYGFDQGGQHYYDKGFARRVAGAPRAKRGRHSWPHEHHCMRAYGRVFGDRFRTAD